MREDGGYSNVIIYKLQAISISSYKESFSWCYHHILNGDRLNDEKERSKANNLLRVNAEITLELSSLCNHLLLLPLKSIKVKIG